MRANPIAMQMIELDRNCNAHYGSKGKGGKYI